MKEIYTPMEQILIKAAMMAQEKEESATVKETMEAALKTKEQFTAALLLDNMLCQAEEKVGLLDGIPLEDWIVSEGTV